MDATNAMQTIRIGGRDFTVAVEQSAPLADGTTLAVYFLTGKRGATYGTMRCMRDGKHTDLMFLAHAGRGFGIPAGFERVRLTDRNGTLEVVQ